MSFEHEQEQPDQQPSRQRSDQQQPDRQQPDQPQSDQQPVYAIVHVPRPYPHVRFALLNVILIFFAYQIAGALLLQVASVLHIERAELLMQGGAQIVFLLIPTLAVMQYSALGRRGLLRTEGGVTAEQWVLGLAGVLPVLVFSAGWTVFLEALMPDQWLSVYRDLQNEIERMYEGILLGSTFWQILGAYIVGAVIPAVSEEVLFRGLMQRSLEEVWPPMWSIAVTGVLFGLIHFNPASTVPLVLIGMYLGLLAWYTRSLALPIAVHFFNNAVAITALNLMGRQEPVPVGSQTPLWQAILLMVVGLVMLGLLLMRLFATPRVTRTSDSGDVLQQ